MQLQLTSSAMKSARDAAVYGGQFTSPDGSKLLAVYTGTNIERGDLVGYTYADGPYRAGQKAMSFDTSGEYTGGWSVENPYTDSWVEKAVKLGILIGGAAVIAGIGMPAVGAGSGVEAYGVGMSGGIDAAVTGGSIGAPSVAGLASALNSARSVVGVASSVVGLVAANAGRAGPVRTATQYNPNGTQETVQLSDPVAPAQSQAKQNPLILVAVLAVAAVAIFGG